jgi:hypothetical protein
VIYRCGGFLRATFEGSFLTAVFWKRDTRQLKQFKMEASMSGKDNWYDNAPIESFREHKNGGGSVRSMELIGGIKELNYNLFD